MDYRREIEKFRASNEQELSDKKVILDFIDRFGYEESLLRRSKIAHITSSGFIMNEELNKVLLVHHNILDRWAWTGGHADGNSNLLEVALEEGKEETGIKEIKALSEDIISIDILGVESHRKNGEYISPHLHLSIAYILISKEKETLKIKPDENSAIKWVGIDWFNKKNLKDGDFYLYNKIIDRSRLF